jgi:hypothetical protein
MASTGSTPISLYYSATASNVPLAANLVAGELAMNTADGKLFFKDSAGVVQTMASKATGSIGGSTTQIQFNNAGVLGGSASLTWSGTVLTSSGFSGPLNGTVGATTPAAGSFTTTTIGTSETLSYGTANGVAYLNGSKVLTSGSALTFDGTNFTAPRTQVTTVGTSPASGAGIEIVGGTTPVILAYNRSTSAYLPFTQYGSAFTWSINAVSSDLVLTSTGLGIGTSSPLAKLDTRGTVFVAGSASGDNILAFGNTSLQGGSLSGAPGGSYGNSFIVGECSNGSGAPGFLKFYTTNSGVVAERMRIDSSGNLGLGVTPSASTLPTIQSEHGVLSGNSGINIIQNAFYNGSFKYTGTGLATRYYQGAGKHEWYTAPSGTAGNAITFTQAMTLDASGNLGIGTTNPSFRLSVFGGQAQFNNGSNLYINATATDIAYYTDAATPQVFYTNGSERMRIDSSGNLLVGTTTASYLLTQGMVVKNPNDIETYVAVGHKTGSGSGSSFFIASYNGGLIGNITQNGTTGVLYNTTSDYRLKTVIGPVANAGQRIDALQPIEYTWNADGSRTRGFLAHQFQEVYAGSVNGIKDAVDAEGKPVYQSMQASSSEVIADLVAEIQSLRKRLAAAGI